MSARPALPFRVLRAGLLAASKAGATVVDRVLRADGDAASGRWDGPRVRPPPPGSPVNLVIAGRRLAVESGVTLLEAARAHDLDLRSYCGGNCSCGTCRVEIVRGAEALSRPRSNESFTLGMEAAHRGDRLACQARIEGEVEIRIPPW